MRDDRVRASARTARSPRPSWPAATPAPPAGWCAATVLRRRSARRASPAAAPAPASSCPGPCRRRGRRRGRGWTADAASARRPADRDAASPSARRRDPVAPSWAGIAQARRASSPATARRRRVTSRAPRPRLMSPGRVRAGEQAHRFAEGEAVLRRGRLHGSELVEHPAESFAIDLDPAAAHQVQAVRRRRAAARSPPRSAARRRG